MRNLILALVIAGCAADPPMGHPGGDRDGGGGGSADARPATGCAASGPAAQPFGNHAHPYASGAILPARSRAELDDAVRAAYSRWKSRYLDPGCVGGRRFVRVGDGNATVSEAQGYGMTITAYMAGDDPQAQEIFDQLYRFVVDHPSVGSARLVAWTQPDACSSSPAASSAADADLDVAYALLLADKQWGSGGATDYRGDAVRMLDAIRRAEVDGGARYVRLGDWTNAGDAPHYDATRSSDFMPGHFASFEAAVGDGSWRDVMEGSYATIASMQSAHAAGTGLLPDFIVHPTSGPAPAPAGFLEGANDGAYAFNACRVPWRLAVHFLTSGDPRARARAQAINAWIRGTTGGNPAAIRAGYTLAGSPLQDFRSNAFVGPLGVGAMVDASNQTWLDGIWDLEASSASEGYYADSLALLSMIAMSGNWWAPESAPCP